MVTGDNIHTAQSIALKSGILTDTDNVEQTVMESSEFNSRIRPDPLSPVSNCAGWCATE